MRKSPADRIVEVGRQPPRPQDNNTTATQSYTPKATQGGKGEIQNPTARATNGWLEKATCIVGTVVANFRQIDTVAGQQIAVSPRRLEEVLADRAAAQSGKSVEKPPMQRRRQAWPPPKRQ